MRIKVKVYTEGKEDEEIIDFANPKDPFSNYYEIYFEKVPVIVELIRLEEEKEAITEAKE